MRLNYNVGSFGRLENGIPTSGHVSHRCDNISNSKRQTSTVKIKELFIKHISSLCAYSFSSDRCTYLVANCDQMIILTSPTPPNNVAIRMRWANRLYSSGKQSSYLPYSSLM
ncbi:unnamed protein product [Albugo candida]|uniref:Uncharacterized protein n=1 Tax=Albugo candida TaxID=65357 RepID=A0A024FZV8_9STRA|nr:unnamed protein product [Albugo candida]|eukprot:CCI39912.1 unnamed protein product [Albugo candida]